jgi:hypothetical protein
MRSGDSRSLSHFPSISLCLSLSLSLCHFFPLPLFLSHTLSFSPPLSKQRRTRRRNITRSGDSHLRVDREQ